ncbi:hypothetical protein [Sphingomonas colocasiae]|uniref:Uncharacterized protein n=1 Tax=Sphingomonas colocasiae TaxID=1848973 RepID=A0ABS7PLS7_9SPHN|nr:hypothetical protein [Sphingomonas colocasiae]MBY8821929.1 hypothetical protein [Sphingomonas colocasiae]
MIVLDMVLSAIRRLEAYGVKVKGIRGYWIKNDRSDNFKEYNKNIDLGMSPKESTLNAWNGRISKDLGYGLVGEPIYVTGNILVVLSK